MSKTTIKSIRFSIKRPIGKRRSFAVMRDTIFLNGTREQIPLEDERITAVNINVQRGLLSASDAYAELKVSIVPALKKEADIKVRESMLSQVSENNRKVFDAFWKDEYEHKELKNQASTRNDILGALRSIDPLSITSASKEDLRGKLNLLPVHQQRRYVIRINQLLQFLGRTFKLDKKSRQSKEVHYVTWDELQEILPHVYSEEVRNLMISLYGTGVRLGEAFTPGFTRLKPNGTIYINKQIDVELTTRDVKNGKAHHTVLLPEAKTGYKNWCEVSTERKEELRTAAINQIIAASKKAFPRTKDKQVSAHDLRHSYAIHWLGLGASLTQIANCLGDTMATTELHYTGFVMTDEQVEGMRKLLK